MVLLAGLVLALGPGREFACLASDDAGSRFVQSPSAVEIEFVPASSANWRTTGRELELDKGSRYGETVASAGNVDGYPGDDILVGAPQYEAGMAYLFLSTGLGLNTTRAWEKTSGVQGAKFGASLAGAGDVNDDGLDDVIVGAPDHKALLYIKDKWKEVQAGRAFVYQGVQGQGLTIDHTWSYSGTVQNGQFGIAVAGAGDVNGDGIDDIAIGARGYTDLPDTELGEGAIYVFFGHEGSGPSEEPDWLIDGDQTGAWFGMTVSAAGDLNDDGCDDLLVGAPKYKNPETGLREGAVFLFLGRQNSIAPPSSVADAAWVAYGGQDASNFGVVVDGAGDVNGDGHPDILVSTPDYDRPSDDAMAGAAFAFCGNGTTLANRPCWTAYGAQLGGGFGASAGGAGDVNGDGFDDVIVGAPTYQPDPVAGFEGAAFLYFGSPAGLAPWAGWKASGDRARTDFGWAVASAGQVADLDGDGEIDDIDGVLIGAPQYFLDEDPYGAAFAFFGSLEPGKMNTIFLPLVLRNAD